MWGIIRFLLKLELDRLNGVMYSKDKRESIILNLEEMIKEALKKEVDTEKTYDYIQSNLGKKNGE